jgi:hydrogenase 3 maturation protease
VGNELRGDDSAGLLVARGLLERDPICENTLVLEGGPAPENLTYLLRPYRPELVIFVDAAHMGEQPGFIAWIPLEAIDGMSASTHSLPLSLLARFLCMEFSCEVLVLGIQPGQNEIGKSLSPEVRTAIEEIIPELCQAFGAGG